ncbi:hypothetical protein C5167_000735 [Papaver somniferum]|uniref:Uncharacterized protein n=1 Tax=Papaver somniferum TaxID=3469 RepID=A0A4Y7KVY1_PAPSO|nr:hypothetical protein C5167_000735 [Papaver somniferum]
MAIHDAVVVEASKEMELVDPPLILSSSPVLKRGLKHFEKNLNEIYKGFDGPIRKIEKKSGGTDVEEDESGDSDMDMEDDEEIGGSSNEDDDDEEEDGEDHDELIEFRVDDNNVDDEMGTARTCAGVEAASSEGLPARLPTFHTSTLGRWCAVISYDACVRLCLRSLARGCSEAPVFLDNECRLLHRAFGLQRVLLQPEGELLAIRSSIPIIKGSSPKTKKPIGRVDVQVRKVKMDLDSPKGCSFSSLHPSKIKMEVLRCCLSNLRSTSSGVRQETYTCILRSKSSNDDKPVCMQPGSGETHLFFSDSVGDDLFLEVQDSTGKYCGCVVAQIDTFIEEPVGGKVRWLPIYREPEHELVGRMQLFIKYNSSIDDSGDCECGSVAETVAYDFVLEVAMKAQHFQQRNLVLRGEWKWLLTEFASYYGISDAYARLRYLSYVMDVATPTADCLVLVYDLLYPLKMKGSARSTLSYQENRILGEIEGQLEQILSLAFENYKALDESSLSGVMDDFRPANGSPAPALAPAVKLYNLLHDIESPDAQFKLCRYFQVAAKKRSRRHLAETDEFVTSNGEGTLMDVVTLSSSYQKMKSLCSNFRNEIFTDIEIHNQHLLPSCIDLPDISSSIYSMELCTRLRAFLVACRPESPSSPVSELVIATAEFQKDLISWNISHGKGGVNAKELFHPYIISWIQHKSLSLLDACKLGVRTQHLTVPFVDYMYDRLKETLSEYEFILCRWPEYTSVLETAIADVEEALVVAFEKQYEDVLSPFKETLAHKFGLKHVEKLAHRSACIYEVPEELGVFMNSIKRMIDMLLPEIETRLQSWSSCIPSGCSTVPGELLREIMVMLRSKLRSYLQAIVEKLVENTKVQNLTRLKKILQELKETVMESDVRSRLQPLKDHLTKTIVHLHSIFDARLFLDMCQRYWDRMGQILDDTFASQMQLLLGNALQEKDLAPPRSIMQVHSVLCKDAVNHTGNNHYAGSDMRLY